MPDSPTIQEAQEQENNYTPNDTVARQLRGKHLVMFVAPAACGKTYLMHEVAKQQSNFGLIPVFTTRAARSDDDPRMFRYLPPDKEHITLILKKIQAREVVQYTVHPNGNFYGSEPADYPNEYNMLPALSAIVTGLQKLPFRATYVVGIVTDPVNWEVWFNERFPVGHPERQKRLQEAVISIEWLLAHCNTIIWANNLPGQGTETAKKIIDAILYNKGGEEAIAVAQALRERIKELL